MIKGQRKVIKFIGVRGSVCRRGRLGVVKDYLKEKIREERRRKAPGVYGESFIKGNGRHKTTGREGGNSFSRRLSLKESRKEGRFCAIDFSKKERNREKTRESRGLS